MDKIRKYRRSAIKSNGWDFFDGQEKKTKKNILYFSKRTIKYFIVCL